jgi:hypothetical protein
MQRASPVGGLCFTYPTRIQDHVNKWCRGMASSIKSWWWIEKRRCKQSRYYYFLNLTDFDYSNNLLNLGISGMILHFMQQAEYRDSNAQKAPNDFRVKSLSIVYREYPEVGLFLLGPEIDAIVERIAQREEIPIFDENLTCYCK